MLNSPTHGADLVQTRIAQVGIEPVLILAPPGCGKTEALSIRAAQLIASKLVVTPEQILALTFSNKARDNLKDRIRHRLGAIASKRHVAIQNFHGFALRVVTHHWNLLELPNEPNLPSRTWYVRIGRELGLDESTIRSAVDIIRRIKQAYVHDDDVAAAIQQSGNLEAAELERQRRQSNTLDFDDVIRYANLLLEREPITRLYRCRFPVVLIDELQDMTVNQLNMALALGADRITLAGDLAQGIYRFAGATPDQVLSTFLKFEPVQFHLSDNYRTTPKILELLNAMATKLDGVQMESRITPKIATDDEVRVLRFDSTFEEANGIVDIASRILSRDSSASIGIMSRANHRLRWIEAKLSTEAVPFVNWSEALDSEDVRYHLINAARSVSEKASFEEQLDLLENRCFELCPDEDLELRDGLVDAIETLRQNSKGYTRLQQWMPLLVPKNLDVVGPGIHLLNAHLGKGQRFDWAFVIGMEEGSIPIHYAKSNTEIQDEFRTLFVMCSRAARGLIFTYTRDVRHHPDRPWLREQSRWLASIERRATGQGDPTRDHVGSYRR